MRLMLCTLFLFSCAASAHTKSATCAINGVTFAGVYLDGGTIEIIANTSCGEIKIVQDQARKTSSDIRSQKYIDLNGNRLAPGSNQEYRLLSDLHAWVLKQTGSRSVHEFQLGRAEGPAISEATEMVFIVIDLIEGVCYARSSARYAMFCRAYVVK